MSHQLSWRHQVHQPDKTIEQVIRQTTQQIIEVFNLDTHKLLSQSDNLRQAFDLLFAKQAYAMSY